MSEQLAAAAARLRSMRVSKAIPATPAGRKQYFADVELGSWALATIDAVQLTAQTILTEHTSESFDPEAPATLCSSCGEPWPCQPAWLALQVSAPVGKTPPRYVRHSEEGAEGSWHRTRTLHDGVAVAMCGEVVDGPLATRAELNRRSAVPLCRTCRQIEDGETAA